MMDGLLIEWGPLLLQGAAMTAGLALTTCPSWPWPSGWRGAFAKDSKRAWSARELGSLHHPVPGPGPKLLSRALIYYGSQILSQNLPPQSAFPSW